jgi:hypothetical protein
MPTILKVLVDLSILRGVARDASLHWMHTDAELATIPTRAVANERPYKIQCRFRSINKFVNDDMARALTNFTKTDLYCIHACFALPLYV